MKKIILSVVIVGGLLSAQAAIHQYAVTFAPEAVGATGTGTGTVNYDDANHLLQLQATFSGLSLGGSGTSVSHIHLPTANPFTGTVGVVLTPGTLANFPVGVRSGAYSNTLNLALSATYPAAFVSGNGGTPAGAEAAVFSAMNAGKSYWNIHSGSFPSGEIRGFLTVVPEPSSLVLAGLGAAGLAARVWQRRRTNKS